MPVDPSDFAEQTPFDAQYVGIYQPIFGWVGRTGKRRIQRDVAVLVQRVMHRVAKQQRQANPLASPRTGGHGVDPLGPATGGGPTFALFNSGGWGPRLLNAARARVELGSLAFDDARPTSRTRRRRANPSAAVREADGVGAAPTPMMSAARETYEVLADNGGFNTNLQVSEQEGVGHLIDLKGWLDEFDFATRDDAQLLLSPIGLLNLYREYYFDFGSRLGPSIEHIWVAPGSEVELIETYSRTDYTFLESERLIETTDLIEATTSESETFADEVEREQQRDIKAGTATQGGATFPVWNAGGSASFDYGNSLRESKRQALERTREVSEKVAREIKRRTRVVSRQSTEIQRTSTRRHRFSTPTAHVRSFEMRRKYHHIGVQVQHLGTSLCWQLYVRRPGDFLRLPELVHIGASEDFLSTPPPDNAPVSLPPEEQEYEVPIQFTPVQTRENDDVTSNTNNDYYRYPIRYPGINGTWTQPLYVATDDRDDAPDESHDVIVAEFPACVPKDGYTLISVTPGQFRGEHPSADQPDLWSVQCDITDGANGKFVVILNSVNFRQQPLVMQKVRLLWQPLANQPNPTAAQGEQYTQELQRKARKAIVDGMRERVRLASSVRPRHSDDLRAEERSVIYRKLIEELVDGAVGSEMFFLSEKIRAIFDIDRMLYYVAPDWWDPRRTIAALNQPSIEVDGRPVTLSDRDRTRFYQDGDGRRDGYLITEDSEPAPRGASLGWIAQLDGDEQRNAFLNSPWVQAVLPIRLGRERAAIEFLRQAHVEDSDGLEAEFLDEDGNPTGQTIEERLLELIRGIRLTNTADRVYEEGQRVFEGGFQPVDGNVQITDKPFEVFAQWVEVVPTRQIVPVEYIPPVPFRSVAEDRDA